jgi:porphobilinogen synthase
MLINRPRRLRNHPKLRALLSETTLTVNDLVQPLFITHGANVHKPISTMPGQAQFSVDKVGDEAKAIADLGIPAVLLFGIPESKDAEGSSSWQDDGVIQQAIREIKKTAPDLLVIADVCFCEYTDHGHCGVLCEKSTVDNDKTLPLLAKQAVSFASAGADILAPSGMMDGMVAVIREGLDEAGFEHLPILSYAVKYASSLYGPFREAAEGSPQFGDRKTYQMNPANSHVALREAELDIQEGADMLMVKPAVNYLDIIYRLKQTFPEMPLGAYHVSGEYAMIKAAAEKEWIDERKVALEILLSIKRAGADFVITYFAKDIATLL